MRKLTFRRPAVRRVTRALVTAGAGLGLAAASVATAQAASPEDSGRPGIQIIGGEEKPDGTHPFTAALLEKGEEGPEERHFCTGSLIHPRIVMTAAHCVAEEKDGKVEVEDPKKLETTVGRTVLSNTKQGQLRDIQDIVVHPHYFKNQLDGAKDMAFLVLKKPVDGIAPVKLPAKGTRPDAKAKATVAGWGSTEEETSPDRLRAATVPIWSHAKCKEAYPHYSKATEICAGGQGKGFCSGDSGGPLFGEVPGRKGVYQLGIVSWITQAGCGAEGKPDVYIDTGSAELWDTLCESAEGKKIKEELGR